MTKRLKPPASLDAKMLYVILTALLAAGFVFVAIYGMGNLAVEKIYLSPEAVSARKAEIYSRFSSYVNANKVSGSDSDAVALWNSENQYTTILIYKDNSLQMRVADGEAQSSASMQNFDRQQYSSQYGKLYPMRFADGVYQIAIGDSSHNREYMVNRFVALIVASVTFVAIMLAYVRRLTRRIIRLSREAVEIGAGDLERPITTGGEDELSMLAREMDNMRRSVIERMGNERRAWQANSELITAISHDIRTPMTTMIGYLGLLNESGFEDRERCSQFCSSAYDKAMELKDLTDELFKYFLVFGRSDLEMNMEPFDGRLLTEQLLSEAEFDLGDAGFTISRIEFEGECSVTVDPMYLKRVMDNLVSNLKKYADRSRQVMIITELKDGALSVCISNYIARSMDRVESTKIGIRTCEKIMAHMGGSFTTTKDEEHFAAEFTLPARTCPEPEPSAR